jgi:hypothetical protein
MDDSCCRSSALNSCEALPAPEVELAYIPELACTPELACAGVPACAPVPDAAASAPSLLLKL